MLALGCQPSAETEGQWPLLPRATRPASSRKRLRDPASHGSPASVRLRDLLQGAPGPIPPWSTVPTRAPTRHSAAPPGIPLPRATPPQRQFRPSPVPTWPPCSDAAPSGTRRSASGHATPPPAEPPLPPRTPLLAEPRGTRRRTEPQTTPRSAHPTVIPCRARPTGHPRQRPTEGAPGVQPNQGSPRAEPGPRVIPCRARPTGHPAAAPAPQGTPNEGPRRTSPHPSAPYLLSITYRWAKSSSRRTCLIRSSTTREPCPAS